MQIYGVGVWEASKPLRYDGERKPIKARELTPQLLTELGKHITRWKPGQWFVMPPSQAKERTKGRKPTVLHNADLVELFDGLVYTETSNDVLGVFDDILHGVARLDMWGNTRPLSKSTLFALLSKADKLSSDIIMEALNVQKRQAQRYMQACKIAQRMIRNVVVERGMYNTELLQLQDSDDVATWEDVLQNDE